MEQEHDQISKEEKSYTQKYQKNYYNTITKKKREVIKKANKEVKEKLAEFLKENPREVTHTCPQCKKVWTELSNSVKIQTYKCCPQCKKEKMKEYQKEAKHRKRANELRRERYKNNEEYRNKIKESFKKYRKKLAEEKKITPVTITKYIHTCPQCNTEWEEAIPSNKHSHPNKVCPACIENKRISELKKIRKPRGRKPFKLEAEFTSKKVFLIKKNNTVESEK